MSEFLKNKYFFNETSPSYILIPEKDVFPEADWDQKASATIHTKKFKRPSKFLQKALFEVLYGRLLTT
jgi:hypothetical protein